MFTIEDVECIAACTEAPCLQVNYRYFGRLDPDMLDDLIGELRSGTGRAADIPKHGTLGLVRQQIPEGRGAGILPPDQVTEAPVWLRRAADAEASEAAVAGDAS